MTSSSAPRVRRGAPVKPVKPVKPLEAESAVGGTFVSTRFLLPATIRVVDEEKREIEMCATSEAVDAHGTIFDYEASKDAFTRWLGNVREMHERRAVGTRIALRFDDAERKVYVRVRVSKGAQDTWEKVLDGTLKGASIGAGNVVWTRQIRNGQAVPVATRYDLAELSLVDAPSNPDTLGFTFVRDGVTLDEMLDALDMPARESAEVRERGAESMTSIPPSIPQAPQTSPDLQIVESGGTLSGGDVAEAIAQAALARGLAEIEKVTLQSATQPVTDVHNLRGGYDAPAIVDSSGAGPELRMGLPTPTRAETPALTGRNARLAAAGIPVPVTRAADGPDSSYDGDGDHDGNVPAADTSDLDSEMAHEPGSLAHAAHEHNHSGGYDDAHEHAGAHMHEDGSSHIHPHLHAHDHHDHHDTYRLVGSPEPDPGLRSARAMDGSHSHSHAHHHAHGHYYRIADGAAIDARMVTGEQVRTREYVSAIAFRAAGGVEGRALSAEQYRVAAGVEQRLEIEAAAQRASRAQGAFSRNPYGAADIGTPAEAQQPAEQTHDELRDGRVRQLDRDGQPMSPTLPAPDRNGGTDDHSAAPSGYTQLTDGVSDGRSAPVAATAAATAGIVASIERALTTAVQPLAARLAALEAQPQAGGPVFNGASAPVEKRDALTPGASGAAGERESRPSGTTGTTVEERIAALRDVASRVSDPGVQVELATQIILLQQEARGNTATPANQAMPLAGNGAMPRPRQRW